MRKFEQDVREWLEPDGLGGFASGTVSGVRTRRYHALLLTATRPPTGRVVLVNGFDAEVETPAGRVALSSQRYAPDVVSPDGASRIVAFSRHPWPTWDFELADGTRIRQEILVPHQRAAALVTWRVVARPEPAGGSGVTGPLRLDVKPFLSGRDYHGTHHENAACRVDARVGDGLVVWHPYDGVPEIVSRSNARYDHSPDWYRRFLYVAERERGLDDTEDLLAPGVFTWDLSSGAAVWLVEAAIGGAMELDSRDPLVTADAIRDAERARRAAFSTDLDRAADAYLVTRGAGETIVAGYPWFTDWGRDTFIALRGLCLATGRFDEARRILIEWAGAVSEGMLPNRFPDGRGEPEYNSVDAALWFIAAAQAFCEAVDVARTALTGQDRDTVCGAVEAILDGYSRGTRFGIHVEADGLLACGVEGVPLTWMDAKVGDRVITPRIGKPVEIQALWLNALGFAAAEQARRGATDGRWLQLQQQGLASFRVRFWNPEARCLYDVVDVDHRPGAVDGSIRPNQILAVGGLPLCLLDPTQSQSVVDAVERHLVTPLGLRSLAPGSRGYVAHYGGGPAERDAAYHQGTVWPWLIGPFVDAWLRVHGHGADAIGDARRRFVEPLLAHLDDAGLGHVSEIAHAEPPFTPGGCPFQAWSVGELIRIERALAEAGTESADSNRPGDLSDVEPARL